MSRNPILRIVRPGDEPTADVSLEMLAWASEQLPVATELIGRYTSQMRHRMRLGDEVATIEFADYIDREVLKRATPRGLALLLAVALQKLAAQ